MAKIIKIPSAFVYESKVVGVSKTNEDGTDRQVIIRREVNEDDPLQLIPEPENKYDPNAIRVLSKFGHQIGYLSAEIASKIKPAIVNQAEIKIKASWVSGEKIVGVGLRIELIN